MMTKNEDTILDKTVEFILAPLLVILIISGVVLTLALVFLFLIPAIFTAIIIAVAIGSIGTAIAVVCHAFRRRSKVCRFQDRDE
ncbi:MAG: hypothetical protein KAR11_05700 [Phycisphaerae bacterium]|nr:hypothetical protein [Phycisphaerae bacterium]